MKKLLFLVPLVLIVITAGFYTGNEKSPKQENIINGPGEWMSAQRMYPYNEIKQDVYLNEMKKIVSKNNKRSGEIVWDFVGPDNIGGRITDIEIPKGQSQTIYIGGASGGILKTDDGGSTWTQKFTGIPTVSIGDIAIDPQDQDVIYAGTGEANASSYSFLGSGIYKSVDGGENWDYSGLEQSAYIGRIIVDNSDSQTIFAAACGNLFSTNSERGIYRSKDGGANWDQVLFVNDSCSAIDLVQNPDNPNVLYAAFWERKRGLTYRNSFGKSSGIWKTSDGGNNWFELTNGLPGSIDKGRIGICISQSNPDVLYAMYDMPNQEMYVFKTADAGQSWQQIDNGKLLGMGSSFAWYFGQIRVDPNDENRVFVLGQIMFRTENAGGNWQQIANNIHVDHHAMCFDNTSGKVYLGNDGGLYWSGNNGSSWAKINNLPLTQFYAFDISNTNPDFMVGGTQDNNSIRTIGGNTLNWQAVLGGDGMYNAINQQDNNIAYAEYQWGNLFRSFNAQSNWPSYDYISYNMENDRKNWSAPLALTPGNNAIVYFGTHRVWKSSNNGSNWNSVSTDLTDGGNSSFNTLTSLAVSSLNQDYVLAGSADGNIHISKDGGSSWASISADLPDRWITRVAFDPIDEETIYATVSGFRWDEPLAHVYISSDMGDNWEAISGDLPEIPVNAIAINPINNQNIIVGTDAGVYITHDGGENWEDMSGNMPRTPVVSLRIIPSSNIIYAATYGNSVFKADLNDLYVGTSGTQAVEQDFTACLTNKGKSKELLIKTFKPQIFTINIYTLSGARAGTINTGLLQKGKNSINIDKYFNKGTALLIFEIIGDSQRISVKAIK
jgi:photosystem II stability/assembly factor-like uncharacterized protein